MRVENKFNINMPKQTPKQFAIKQPPCLNFSGGGKDILEISRSVSRDTGLFSGLKKVRDRIDRFASNNLCLPVGRPLEFLQDTNYRKTLAKRMDEKPEALQSVVGANELKYVLRNRLKKENFLPGANEVNVKNGDFTANMHIHTTHTDGEHTPLEWLEKVKEYADKIKKPVLFSITDHNSAEGNIEVIQQLAKSPEKYKRVRFVPGIEIRTTYKNKAGQDVEREAETLVYGLNPFRHDYWFFLSDWMEHRTSKEIADFYKEEDVVKSLAHPKRIPPESLPVFLKDEFKPNGGHAMEVFYSYSESAHEHWAQRYGIKKDMDESSIQELGEMANKAGLLSTGGRDCHGKNFFHRA